MDVEEGLQIAIAAEQAAHKRYEDFAKDAPDAETRSLFQQLAKWESEHERLLRDRLTAIRLLKSGGGA